MPNFFFSSLNMWVCVCVFGVSFLSMNFKPNESEQKKKKMYENCSMCILLLSRWFSFVSFLPMTRFFFIGTRINALTNAFAYIIVFCRHSVFFLYMVLFFSCIRVCIGTRNKNCKSELYNSVYFIVVKLNGELMMRFFEEIFWYVHNVHLAYCFRLCMCNATHIYLYEHNIFFLIFKLFFHVTLSHSLCIFSEFNTTFVYQYKICSSLSITKRNRLPEYKIILLHFLVVFSLPLVEFVFYIHLCFTWYTHHHHCCCSPFFGIQSDFPHQTSMFVCLNSGWILVSIENWGKIMYI